MVEALLNGLLGIGEKGFAGTAARAAQKSAGAAACATKSAGTESGATDPVLCLLLWAALLHSEGRLDRKLLRQLGVDEGMFESLSARHPVLLEKLRWLRLAGMLFSRESICTLLTARLAEMLVSATKPSELLAITRAMERMPDWAWGEGQDTGNGTRDSGESNCKDPAAEAMQQVRELLAEQAEGEADAELVEKQQRLADRLDDFLVAPRPEVKSSTRGGKRTVGKQRRR